MATSSYHSMMFVKLFDVVLYLENPIWRIWDRLSPEQCYPQKGSREICLKKKLKGIWCIIDLVLDLIYSNLIQYLFLLQQDINRSSLHHNLFFLVLGSWNLLAKARLRSWKG